MSVRIHRQSCDVLVAGGGLAGICAAVQAGRMGMKVILAEKEMQLGGNAGPNLGVCATGALSTNPYYNEMGIIEEFEERVSFREGRMRPTVVNYNIHPFIDSAAKEMLDKANVQVLRRHLAYECRTRENRIETVKLLNLENLERTYVSVRGSAIDCTGGRLACAGRGGRPYESGREGRSETGERSAPEQPDAIISAASLTALVVDTGIEGDFIPPEGVPAWNEKKPASRFDPSQRVHFLWQVDEGGENEENHSFYSAQDLYERLVFRIYSQWNYLKNIRYPDRLRTHQLIWISPILGKREGFRIEGDYLLTQTDIENCRAFPDSVAFGGSFLDEHLPSRDGGYKVRYYARPQPYDIPYRCIYSRNIHNLFAGGRAVGVSHLAFTSVRLMRTGCSLAQAAGAAAALCLRHGVSARELGEKHIGELQQTLLRWDVFLPGVPSADPYDLARSARVTATSEATFDRTPDPASGTYTDASGGVYTAIYCYPPRLQTFTVFVRNRGGDATVTGVLGYGETQPQEFWDAPAVVYERRTKTVCEEAADIAPEGTDDITSVAGCRNYFVRRDSIAKFDRISECRKRIPGGYEGEVTFELPDRELPPYRRGIWEQAAFLGVQGPVEVVSARHPLDVCEGRIGEAADSRQPVMRTVPEIIPGAAAQVRPTDIITELAARTCTPGSAGRTCPCRRRLRFHGTLYRPSAAFWCALISASAYGPIRTSGARRKPRPASHATLSWMDVWKANG